MKYGKAVFREKKTKRKCDKTRGEYRTYEKLAP